MTRGIWQPAIRTYTKLSHFQVSRTYLVPSPPWTSSLEDPFIGMLSFSFKVVLHQTVVILSHIWQGRSLSFISYVLISTRRILGFPCLARRTISFVLCESDLYFSCLGRCIPRRVRSPLQISLGLVPTPSWRCLTFEVLVASSRQSFAWFTFSHDLPSNLPLLAQRRLQLPHDSKPIFRAVAPFSTMIYCASWRSIVLPWPRSSSMFKIIRARWKLEFYSSSWKGLVDLSIYLAGQSPQWASMVSSSSKYTLPTL